MNKLIIIEIIIISILLYSCGNKEKVEKIKQKEEANISTLRNEKIIKQNKIDSLRREIDSLKNKHDSLSR